MTPTLSVIIPCYNNGKLLAEMLDCCINQTYSDWEVIVVDDGSTDDTPSIVKEYATKDSRINFYSRNRMPKGSLTSRNIGFEHATGKYIIHFDADDLVSNTCFQNRVNFMETHPNCDYATFKGRGFTMVNGKMKIDQGTPYGVNKTKGDLLTGFLTTHYPFSIWNNIYRKQSIGSFVWDERVKVYSDFSYAVPMILSGLKQEFSEQKEADYFYRQFYSANNMCASAINENKCESTLYLFNKTLLALKQREDGKRRLNEFWEFVITHYRRLLLGGVFSEVEKYIAMLSQHYPQEKIVLMKNTCKNVQHKKPGRVFELKVYWQLYKKFNFVFDKTMVVHTLAKIILMK